MVFWKDFLPPATTRIIVPSPKFLKYPSLGPGASAGEYPNKKKTGSDGGDIVAFVALQKRRNRPPEGLCRFQRRLSRMVQ